MCSFGGILQHFVWYDSSNKDLFIREGVTPMVFVITGNNSERLRKWSELVCKTYPGCVIYEYIDPIDMWSIGSD